MEFNLFDFILFKERLSKKKIIAISQEQIKRYNLDCDHFGSYARDIAYESEFHYKKNLVQSVIKMSLKRDVDRFFETGSIKLGTFKYYREFENKEIGDRREGAGLLVNRVKNGTLFSTYQEGHHHYVFCTYDGEPNPKVVSEFGYDDAYEIFDIENFNKAIEKVIDAEESVHSNCLYRKMKVAVSDLNLDITINGISRQVIDTIGPVKYFIKTVDFNHQKEYRFLWKKTGIQDDFRIIKCPEAVQYCRRL